MGIQSGINTCQHSQEKKLLGDMQRISFEECIDNE